VARGAAAILPHRWTLSTRVLANQNVERATWRNTLMYRLTDDLQLGVEYNPLAGQVRPLANWRLVRETSERPFIMVGTSSDRIGTPTGQMYYLTVGKALGDRFSVYGGVAYSEFDRRLLYPAGANYQFDERWSVLVSYDGVSTHPMVTYAWDRYSVTFLMVRSRDPGINLTVGF
jgi:hypothetical protein